MITMMAIDNPELSLKNINDLQSKVTSNSATVHDYEELDSLIALVTGSPNYIKNFLIQNAISDFANYINLKSGNNEAVKSKIALVQGTILGAIDFLKSYAIRNRFL